MWNKLVPNLIFSIPFISMYRFHSVVQSELGDVVYVELPEAGSEVKKGETFGVVESVKVRNYDNGNDG